LLGITLVCACEKEKEKESCVNTSFFDEYGERNFEMGFSTWAYAPRSASVDSTYLFLSENATIYSEHIDYKIPWNAWINDLALPVEFTNEIAGRKSRKIANAKLTVSVSLLNNGRSDLATDFDGTTPAYTAFDDK